jgi:hypothetical protein
MEIEMIADPRDEYQDYVASCEATGARPKAYDAWMDEELDLAEAKASHYEETAYFHNAFR